MTFSATLRYFNLFLFTIFSFHLFIFNLSIPFYPNLTHSNLFLFTIDFFTPLWYVRIKILIGGVTFCSTCLGCLINKTTFFLEGLYVPSFILFQDFLYVQSFNFRCTLLPLLVFLYCIYQNKFHPYIIHPGDWTFVV